MMSPFRSLVILVVALAAIPLPGCGGAVKVNVKSEADLNSVANSAPLPVVVRVYLLEDDTAFKNADFRALWKQDTEVLGNSMLARKEIVVQPTTTEYVEIPYNERTRFVAGMAIFRSPSSSQWRFIEPVSNNMVVRRWRKVVSASVSVRLRQNKIELVD